MRYGRFKSLLFVERSRNGDLGPTRTWNQKIQNPIIFALLIDPWCNGSTPDFGSVSQGSNPCGSTKISAPSLVAKP